MPATAADDGKSIFEWIKNSLHFHNTITADDSTQIYGPLQRFNDTNEPTANKGHKY